MSSKVYFMDLQVNIKQNLLDKLESLWEIAGFDGLVKENDLVAFKVDFGERGNLPYIKPQFIRRLADRVKGLGAKPFVTDANTLCLGSRSNAIDHTITAIENGWDYGVVGAPIIIADGLTGKDYINVQIKGKHFKEVKIGSAVVHADTLIAVSTFGGTLKNIGMGLGSRHGKQMMQPDIFQTANKENGAGYIWQNKHDDIHEKIAEYTLGALEGKRGKSGFITFINKVTPTIGDVGMIASIDPIAIEQAAIDLVNNKLPLPDSKLNDQKNYEKALGHGEELGLGKRKYELIKL